MSNPIFGKTKAQLNREGHTETATQRYCLDRLQLMEMQGKAYFFRNNSFSGAFSRPNGSTGFINNGKAGKPDIVACIGGRFIGIEVKGPEGVLSKAQILAQKAIEDAGGMAWTIYCPEDLDCYLKSL